MPIATEKSYKIVCPICGCDYDDGDRVPLFSTKKDVHDFLVGNLDWSDGEPMGRAIARACRITGCGEAAWDNRRSRKTMKLTTKEKKALNELAKLCGIWPKSLKMFARAGKLIVLKPGNKRTVREATVFENLQIPIDGGDPSENDLA